MRPICLIALVLVVAVIAWAKKAIIYVPPKFWTHEKVFNCKSLTASKMRCAVDIDYVGYSIKPPSEAETNHDFPKDKIEVQKEKK